VAAILLQASLPAFAQLVRPPESGGQITSIGQPKRYRFLAGVNSGLWSEGPGSSLLVRGEAGVSRHLMSPVVGLLEGGLEGFVGMRGDKGDGGLRAMLNVPYLGMGVGGEYNVPDAHLNFVVGSTTPVRRGGIITPGGMLRINWYPWASHGFTIGFMLPLGDPLAGRTRPVRDYVVVARDFAPPIPYQVSNPKLNEAIDSLAVSAEWIRRLTVPFLDQDARDTRTAEARVAAFLAGVHDHLAQRSSEQEIRHFHVQLERAFRIAAANDSIGSRMATIARRILLYQVILPYNSLLGQKKKKDELVELGIGAHGRFSREAVKSGLLSGPAMEPVLYVFQRLTGIMEQVRVKAAKQWDDPRLVWLPLQYSLLPDQYDDQQEIDALVDSITGVKFTDNNEVRYLANLQFHWELLRTIKETEDYHVLWIHDFPAITSQGLLDSAALDQVIDGYLTTLAERVEAYDSVGRIPMYFIFLDEHYYEARKSRIWMTILEDPLHASSAVTAATRDQQARLKAALDRLRAAVKDSKVLQAEARQYGDAWLRNRVKVHVNITNRADPSFWSGGLVSTVFGYPDNVMRDHRKIVFRDVTEASPFRGEALYTGMGVGQQYLGPTWDDRAIRVKGPALLELKRAARNLLLSQGIPESDLPPPFRFQTQSGVASLPQVADASRVFFTRALQLSNGTGYLPKPLNVGKALLYSLMGNGAVIKVPDSLWNSFLYAGLLVGACLRGTQVLIVAPAALNMPSFGAPQLTRSWELATRLLMVRDTLGGPIGKAGGMLQVGLYTLAPDQRGLASRAQTWIEQVGQTVFLKGLMPFYDNAQPAVADAATRDGLAAAAPPKLHQKVQFIATGAFWSTVSHAPEWRQFMDTYLRYREATYNAEKSARGADSLENQLSRLAEQIYRRVRGVPGAASYAIVGSQNQDYRGMFMDGEVAMVFSGAESLVPLVDVAFLEGTVTWLQDRATLDRLLPPPGEYTRRLVRVGKDGL
jgi:hypothetical protein